MSCDMLCVALNLDADLLRTVFYPKAALCGDRDPRTPLFSMCPCSLLSFMHINAAQ